MTAHPAHEPHVVTPSVRERLAQMRAEKALSRRLGWLGAGKRWVAFALAGCACGCGNVPDPPAGRRAAHR